MNARRTRTAALLLGGAMAAGSAEPGALPLYKAREELSLEWKSYRLSTGETLSLYGVARRRFLTAHWYWGEAGYGAVTGRQGGYFEGGAALGCRLRFLSAWTSEARLFSGAGGGGNLEEGGGWLLHPSLGLAWNPSPRAGVSAAAGYAGYVNGDLRGWAGSFSIRLGFWSVE